MAGNILNTKIQIDIHVKAPIEVKKVLIEVGLHKCQKGLRSYIILFLQMR